MSCSSVLVGEAVGEPDAAFARCGDQLRLHGGCAESGKEAGEVCVVDATHQLGCFGRERVEGAVTESERDGTFAVGLEPVAGQHGLGDRQRAFGAEPAQAGGGALLGADVLAAVAGDAQCGGRRRLVGAFLQDGVE